MYILHAELYFEFEALVPRELAREVKTGMLQCIADDVSNAHLI